jgi:hypothetical protein
MKTKIRKGGSAEMNAKSPAGHQTKDRTGHNGKTEMRCYDEQLDKINHKKHKPTSFS